MDGLSFLDGNLVDVIAEFHGGDRSVIKFTEQLISANPPIFESKLKILDKKVTCFAKTIIEARNAALLQYCMQQGLLTPKRPSSALEDEDAYFRAQAWFKDPKAYLNNLSMKYKLKLAYKDVKVQHIVKVEAVLDEIRGLKTFGEGSTKKDASYQAALRLCRLIDKYLQKHGHLYKEVPEYRHYRVSEDLDPTKYPWHANPKAEVPKIAMALGKHIEYRTEQAPLDPNTHICSLIVDEDALVIGYGRSGDAKLASKLAAIDFCLRFGHLVQLPGCKGNSLRSSKINLVAPSAEIAVPLVNAPAEGSPMKLEDPKVQDLKFTGVNEERLNLIKGSIDTSGTASCGTWSLPSNLPLPMTFQPQCITPSSSTASSTSSKATAKNCKEEKVKKNTVTWERDFAYMFQSSGQNLARTVNRLISERTITPPRGHIWNVLGAWDCELHAKVTEKGMPSKTITAQSPQEKMKKWPAAEAALAGLVDGVFQYLRQQRNQMQEMHRPQVSMKADQVSSKPESVAQPLQIAHLKTSTSESPISEPVSAKQAKLEPTDEIVLSNNKEAAHLMVSLSGVTVKSLNKWFEVSKNFGRFASISAAIARRPEEVLCPPQISVNVAMIDRKSQSLLQDMAQFQTSAQGQDILNYRASLPIFPYKEDILGLVRGNQVSLISGENGYGKSTQVPNYVLEQMTAEGHGAQCNIIVVSMSSLAAKTAAASLAAERAEPLGVTVRHSEEPVDDGQRFGSITFCTGEVFLERLRHNPDMYGFSHVIIDNVEDVSLLMDFMLASIRLVLSKRPEMRLVMLSSLIEASPLATYFEKTSFSSLIMAPFAINIRQYFLEDYAPLLNKALLHSKDSSSFVESELAFNPEDPTDDSCNVMPYSLVEAVLGQLCMTTAVCEPILVFLPSGEEISTLFRYLTEDDVLKIGYANPDAFRFVFVHSHIKNLEDVYRADFRDHCRKIYLCTSDAETTFPTTDVVHVVDTCRYKPKLVESTSGEMVSYHWISQVECIRRSRCAGRISGVGSYYALMSLKRFSAMIPEPVPALKRCSSLYSCCLAKRYLPDQSLQTIIPSMLRASSGMNVSSMIDVLRSLQILDDAENLTSLGLLLSRIPIPVQTSRLLVLGVAFRCLDPALNLAAISFVGSPLIAPIEEASQPDHIAALTSYTEWWTNKPKLGGRSKEAEFCRERHLDHAKLVKIAQVRHQLLGLLMESGVIVSAGKIFNRFMESPESKDALMTFLNENSQKMRLLRAIVIVFKYPSLTYCILEQNLNPNVTVMATTAVDKNVCTRSTPLTSLLLISLPIPTPPSPTDDFNSYKPSSDDLNVKGWYNFSFKSQEAATILTTLKVCLNVCLQWIITRLAYPTNTCVGPEYSEEEIVRFIDNVIRTSISLLETEKAPLE